MPDFTYVVLTTIKAPINRVQQDITKLLAGHSRFPEHWEVSQPTDPNFQSIYEEYPATAGSVLPKLLLWEPAARPETTAFLSNYSDGYDSLIDALAKQFGHETMSIAYATTDSNYPHQEFNYRHGNELRLVRAAKETGKWEFFQLGDIRPFEDPSNYRKRYVKQRLSPDVIRAYMKQLGWDIESDSFWQTNREAVRMDRLQWSAAPAEALTINEIEI